MSECGCEIWLLGGGRRKSTSFLYAQAEAEKEARIKAAAEALAQENRRKTEADEARKRAEQVATAKKKAEEDEAIAKAETAKARDQEAKNRCSLCSKRDHVMVAVDGGEMPPDYKSMYCNICGESMPLMLIGGLYMIEWDGRCKGAAGEW